MYEDSVNINSTVGTKWNLFKEFDDQIEQKNKKGTKMNQTNKLADQNGN